MVNNTTNINNTITSHLNSLNKKNIMTYDIENPGPGLGQALKCGRVKPCMVARDFRKRKRSESLPGYLPNEKF